MGTGIGVGAGIGAIVNACRDKVTDARSALNCCILYYVESARSTVCRSESKISSLQSDINRISSKIRSLERENVELH